MNPRDFKPGDILLATHRELTKGKHPIVFISGHSDTDFVGAMLTHCEDETRNIKMDSAYFVIQKDFDKSYLVIGKFIKSEEWGPFTKINKLTLEGLRFVNQIIADLPLETFANYFRRNATRD